jgi:hypothetical protein
MQADFELLIHEAIQLEFNVGKLYKLFYRLLPGDSDFWWKLAMEEENHAALLKTVRQMEASRVKIPMEILPTGVAELQEANNAILEAIADFEKQPDRAKAFKLALKIEQSAGESHYDKFMNDNSDSHIKEVFRKLNREDANHAERILQYMMEHKIN